MSTIEGQGVAVRVSAPAAAADHYAPSGRVAWPEFCALALAAAVVAATMAYVLALVLQRAPDFIGVSFAFAVPVVIAIVAAVYFGRCRNRAVALALAITLAAGYLVAAWAIAYQAIISFGGPRLADLIARATGLRGPVGFFLLTCDPTFGRFGRPGVTALLVGLHALEFGLVVAAAVYAARWFGGRVFYERHNRWASSWTFGFDRAHLGAVLEMLTTRDWPVLGGIEKVTVTRYARRRGIVVFRVECLPYAGEQEVYVTVEGPRLWRMGWLLEYVPFVHRLTRQLDAQRTITAEEARELARQLPGFGIGSGGSAASADDRRSGSPASDGLAYWNDTPRSVSVAGEGSGLVSAIRETGLLGTTLVGRGDDFRGSADRATIRLTLGAPTIEIDSVDASLCMPAEPAPLPMLRRLSRIDLVVPLGILGCGVIGFVLPWAAIGLDAAGFDRAGQVILGSVPLLVGASAVLAIASFVGLQPLHVALLRRHFGRRGESILPPLTRARGELVRIEDPATFHISKLTPEDWGIAFLDRGNRRVLIEGVSHRYVLRGQDAVEVTQVKGASAHARVTVRVGEATLGLVINRHGPLAFWLGAVSMVPAVGIPIRPLARRVAARWALRLARALDVPLSTTPVNRTT